MKNRTKKIEMQILSPPLVRAMANTLCDHNIDVLSGSPIKAILTLHRAGFSFQELETNLDAAMHMASIRQSNERRKG